MQQKPTSESDFEKKIITIPNLLSFLRLCLIPVILWLYWAKQNPVAAGGVLLFSGVTDTVDGWIARRFHMTSNLGKILDPIADKLTQGIMLICLLFRFPWMIAPIMLMAVKELFMSVTGILVIRKTGVVFGARWHGKIATCLLYGVVLLHFFWNGIPPAISVLSVAVCSVMIGVSFFFYGIRNIKTLMGDSK